MNKKTRLAIFAAGTATLALAVAALIIFTPGNASNPLSEISAPSDSVTAPTAAQLATLPEARYDAVIGSLIPVTSTVELGAEAETYTLKHDAALYGVRDTHPIARLAAENFALERTTVIATRHSGDWTLILTPARRSLPSKSGGDAAAQTAAWIRTIDLTGKRAIDSAVTISVADETLAVRRGRTVTTFKIGVGMDTTPTPVNVTGYLQARYLDPTQGQSVHPIQLTSLHSRTVDEPLVGGRGGLIGIHYQIDNTGKVSHGCIRLTAAAITAVNDLPLGTPITITP
ncbi:L,D-transpeptidase [Leifsonia aquatica]|uniref:L,D-transpeptidase n=1 Tax=Leifsonia aquatica TaxID=144185 RepID=UPI00382CBC61